MLTRKQYIVIVKILFFNLLLDAVCYAADIRTDKPPVYQKQNCLLAKISPHDTICPIGYSAITLHNNREQAQPIIAEIIYQTESCHGLSTAYAEINASGGVPPYIFSIDKSGVSSPPCESTYIFNNLSRGDFIVKIKDSYGFQVTVPLTIVESSPLSAGGHNSSPLLVCDNYNPQMLYFTTPIKGGQEPYSYQWYINDNPVHDAQSDSYDPPNLQTGVYRINCRVTDKCGSTLPTKEKLITVVPDPVVTISGGGNYCRGDMIILSAEVIGGTGKFTYRWRVGLTNEGPWDDVTTTTDSLFYVPSDREGLFHYSVILSASGAACNSSTSKAVEVLINSPPEIISSFETPIKKDTEPGLCKSRCSYDIEITGVPQPDIYFEFSGATTGNGDGTGSGSWFNAGITEVEITSVNCCGAEKLNFNIVVIDNEPPHLTPLDPLTVCVENLMEANYNDNKADYYPDYLCSYSFEGDFYKFSKGDILLDLSKESFSDNCCSEMIPGNIEWVIDFEREEPSIYGIGQISELFNPVTGSYNSIRFWGDGLTFKDSRHIITYRVTDCNNNKSTPVKREVIVKPRPYFNMLIN